SHDDVVGVAYGLTVGPGSALGINFGGHAVKWPGAVSGSMIDLNDGLDPSYKKDWILIAAFSISDDGDIVGRAVHKKPGKLGGKYHAFLLKGKTFIDLGALKEDAYDSSAAYALNACGTTVPEIEKVVGYTFTKEDYHYGFTWTESSGLVSMGTLPPYSSDPT